MDSSESALAWLARPADVRQKFLYILKAYIQTELSSMTSMPVLRTVTHSKPRAFWPAVPPMCHSTVSNRLSQTIMLDRALMPVLDGGRTYGRRRTS
jgi:hypothetical protein